MADEKKPAKSSALFIMEVFEDPKNPTLFYLEINQILKTKPLEKKEVFKSDSASHEKIDALFRKIISQPYPTLRQSNSGLSEPQSKVSCPGRTTREGKPKEYMVPSNLLTYTRRGFKVELEPKIKENKITWCIAKLIDDKGVLRNKAYGRSPWNALVLLGLMTSKYFDYLKDNKILVNEIDYWSIPDGCYYDKVPGEPSIKVECPKIVNKPLE